MGYRAVIFDLGGVVFDSPLHAIARFEAKNEIPDGFVNRLVVSNGRGGAWARLERGELGIPAFCEAFDRESLEAGQELDSTAMMAAIAEASQVRPVMVSAIAAIRSKGLGVAALTNNWVNDEPVEESQAHNVRPLFDVFVESAVLGLRKPDPRIYQHTCSELDVSPSDAVFLDDIGRNLKAARELGMHTIKVDEPETALRELAGVLGFDLGLN
ncbi:MAG: HAD family phosphatase [bacterium]|nr:HAD family phosphatase [bacterium]